MVENVTQVAWKLGFLASGWSVTETSRKRDFLFSWNALFRAPKNLRSPHALRDFDRLLESNAGGTFLSWWDQVGAAAEDKYYALDFPSGRWEIPWEILILRLKQTEKHGTICILRSSGVQTSAAPSAFSDPMRMLVIQGDDGDFLGQKIDLGQEAKQIMEAWEALDAVGRGLVERPAVAAATRANLSALVAQHRPHVLWFSGHGGRKPHSHLLLADRHRVSAKEFAALIRASGHTPLYVVFWACDTGARAENTAPSAGSPDFFTELKEIGVLSVLAIQSPIRDSNATVLARQLFSHLSSGLSLEIAATRARAALIDDPADDTVLDWASPVVWSTVQPVRKLQWNQLPSDAALNQLLGRKILRLGTSRPVQLEQKPDPADVLRATEWLRSKQTWVQADPKEPIIRRQWFLTLQTVQQQTSQFVMFVDLKGCEANSTERNLRLWAEEIRSTIIPGDLPDWFAALVGSIVDLPASGWQHLCETRDMVLAVCDPPPYATPSWFWEPLLAQNRPQVFALSAEGVDEHLQDSWTIDKLGDIVQEDNILQAIQQAPRLAASLAVSRMPIGQSYIYLTGADVEGAGSLTQWPNWPDVTVNTPAGPIMTATARRSVLGKLDQAARIQAHKDWLEILSHMTVVPSTPILHERLTHLLAAEMIPEALDDAAGLLAIYREQDRPNAALALLDEIGDHRVDLPSDASLRAAWATLQFGEVEEAQYWLDRTIPSGSLETAWKHGLQAEIDKGTGAKGKALAEIESAVNVCASALLKGEEPGLLIERRLRAYRQDRARILHYLFGRLEEARAEYERLVTEWTNDAEAQFDLAVVKRNLAPCLESLASQNADLAVAATLQTKAEDQLQEALDLAENTPNTPLLSEILYEKARFEEAKQRRQLAGIQSGLAEDLLRRSIEAASQSRHFMLVAIAENRHFWRYEPFLASRWIELRDQLRRFHRHGWAVRTLVTGHLRAARAFSLPGRTPEVLENLHSALTLMKLNPSFTGRSDKFRIAATFAGLEVVGGEKGSWQQFLDAYPAWAPKWLEEQRDPTPNGIWQEVR